MEKKVCSVHGRWATAYVGPVWRMKSSHYPWNVNRRILALKWFTFDRQFSKLIHWATMAALEALARNASNAVCRNFPALTESTEEAWTHTKLLGYPSAWGLSASTLICCLKAESWSVAALCGWRGASAVSAFKVKRLSFPSTRWRHLEQALPFLCFKHELWPCGWSRGAHRL